MKCSKCGKRVTWNNSAGLRNHLYCMECVKKVQKKHPGESLAETIEWICYEGYLREKGDMTEVN